MSMVSAMDALDKGILGGIVGRVSVLYSSRRKGKNEEVLFEQRLKEIAKKWDGDSEVDYGYTFFETGGIDGDGVKGEEGNDYMMVERRRISHQDLFEALGPVDKRANTVVYICGLPDMTDEFVELLKNTPGMEEKRVLCEKWW